MPCAFPLQSFYSIREDGKKDITFCSSLARSFALGSDVSGPNSLSLPCGRCMPCRLERSRQVALRCMHEASLNEDNCFITLTYSPDNLPQGGTLVKRDVVLFLKKLRRKFSDVRIRYFGCGEYGENFARPHYHLCLFNFDFKDKVKLFKDGDYWYYQSSVLDKLWAKGRCVIGDFNFDTAAYCARYVTKKINGSLADEHYKGRLPEYAIYSNRPGIGGLWFDKYGKSSVLPHDNVVVRGVFSKPPRYYDILHERLDPENFSKVKEARRLLALDSVADNTHARLAVKLECMKRRFKKLIRTFESSVL